MSSLNLIKPYFAKNAVRIAAGLTSLVIVDFLQLLIPRILKKTVDALTADTATLKTLLHFSGAILGIALLIGVFRYIWRRCLIGLSRLIERDLRDRLFAHVQRLSASYFDMNSTGDLMARATNDITNIRMATGMGLVALTDAVVLGMATIGFMLYIHPWLTMLVLIPMPLIVVSAKFFSKKMHEKYRTVQEGFSTLTETVREQLSGIRIVKAFTMEHEAASKVEKRSLAYVKKNLSLVRVTKSFFPLMLFFSNLSLGLVLFLGGRGTILREISPGDFVAFISYIGLLTWPMMAMGWVVNLIQRGRTSLERIEKVIASRPEIRSAPGAVSFEKIQGKISFVSVSFAYPTGKGNRILHEIGLTIEPSSSLGVVGPPGSGKSTLAGLVPRLYDPTNGRIEIDGIDTRKLDLFNLRKMISFVPQEPFLFSGTIRENITLHRSCPEKRLFDAIKRAGLERDIELMPAGIETMIGERGVILSGGQKQRIAIARALVEPGRIMIFDDPVSQVDAATQERIIKTIYGFYRKATLVVISHRIAAVRPAERILVLENGRVTGLDTHEKLLESNRYYAKTCRLQDMEASFNAF